MIKMLLKGKRGIQTSGRGTCKEAFQGTGGQSLQQ